MRTLANTLAFVGVMEHYDASICLLLHTFQVDDLFFECCANGIVDPSAANRCALLSLSTTTNSASDKVRGEAAGGGGDGYLAGYLEDEELLGALYDGNRVDCELYSVGLQVFAARLQWMEAERGLAPGLFSRDVFQVTPVQVESDAGC